MCPQARNKQTGELAAIKIIKMEPGKGIFVRSSMKITFTVTQMNTVNVCSPTSDLNMRSTIGSFESSNV